MKERKALTGIYKKLYSNFGPQEWWPAKTSFEVMIGAILTQNTAWANVEKAIKNLKKEKMLSVNKIDSVSMAKLRSLIKPSGFYNEKAKKLKTFVRFLKKHCKGNINKLRQEDTKALRKKLEGIAAVEIKKTLQAYGMSDDGRQAVERMTQALINKILHDPTDVLKRNGCQGGRSAYLDITRKLFKLDE